MKTKINLICVIIYITVYAQRDNVKFSEFLSAFQLEKFVPIQKNSRFH
jgi:hypothetical protein